MEHISRYTSQESIRRTSFGTRYEIPLGLLPKREHPLRRGSTWLTVAMLIGIAINIGLGFWVASMS